MQGHGIQRFCNAGFEKCCLNRIKVEPCWDAHKFLCYAGCPLQMSIVLIAVYYLRRGIIPYGRKRIVRKCYTNLTKKVISVPIILLSSSVKQKLAFHKDLQYLIRSSCVQGPKRI